MCKYWITAVCIVLLSDFQSASASVITSPPGLAIGEQYRLVFVTNDGRDGLSPNASDYSSFVSAQANQEPLLVALDTDWNSLTTTFDGVSARDNTSTHPGTDGGGIPIYDLNGNLIAGSYATLWDGGINHPIAVNQFGVELPARTVWTGSHWNGTARRVLGHLGQTPTGGWTGNTDGAWMWSTSANHTDIYSVYGMSGVLEVGAPVPEPSSYVLAVVGLLAFGILAWQRR